jgi:hypothetical protein
MTECYLVASSKEGYGSKTTVSPMMMMVVVVVVVVMMMMMMMMHVSCFYL